MGSGLWRMRAGRHTLKLALNQSFPNMNKLLSLWQKLSTKPFGKWLFTRAVCYKAPYFATIKPRFEVLAPGYAKVSMKQRRSVQNHIQSIHAIALCNLAELGAGTMMEASLSNNMRWLPRGMTVQYLKVAKTDVIAECIAADIADGLARDVIVKCDIRDTADNIVCHADIAMYVSPRKAVTASV